MAKIDLLNCERCGEEIDEHEDPAPLCTRCEHEEAELEARYEAMIAQNEIDAYHQAELFEEWLNRDYGFFERAAS